MRNLQHETSQNTFEMPNQSQHLLHTLYKCVFCVCFSYILTFLEIIRHNTPKMLLSSSIFKIKMVTQEKITKFDNPFKCTLMGWGGRQEGRSGWGTHVNPWLIHVNVWQNPLQYCKVISLQLTKINEKINK